MYVVHGPISMRRMKSMGQEALSLPWVCLLSMGEIPKLRIGTYWRIYRALPNSFQSLDVTKWSEATDCRFLQTNQRIGRIMSTIAIVYHSGFGHTQALAEAVAKGAQAVPGTKVSLV